MAVYVNFKGRLGNWLFSYCAARLFAEQHKLELRVSGNPFTLTAIKDENGDYTASENVVCNEPQKHIITDSVSEDQLHKLAETSHIKTFVFDGWFQDWRRYWPHREQIRDWFRDALVEYPVGVYASDESLTCHVRLGDYATAWKSGSRIITPGWYAGIINRANPAYLTIVMSEMNFEYVRRILERLERKPVSVCLERRAWQTDFRTLMTAKNMVMSNSTFAWWAYFLGSGQKAFVFPKWVDDPQVTLTGFTGATAVDGEFDR